jgi:tetratricopeptide (TPR) repeat protein
MPASRTLFRILPLASLVASGVLPGSAETPAAIEYLPNGATRMSYEQRVTLNSRWDLGYYLFQMQEFGAAAKEFEKIRQVLPNDPSLLALIGSCYSMSGQWSQGEKALLEASAQNPDDDDINGLLGQFYVSAGQSLKGAAYLEHSLRITPGQDDIRARLATLYLDAGRIERAKYNLEYLLRSRGEEAMASGFGIAELDYAYSRCLIQSGRFTDAQVFADFAHKAEPANARYARALGLCLMGNNRYAEAARMLSAGRNEIQAEEIIYLQWGEALFLDRRWESAEAVWLEGVSRFPKSYELMSRLVEYYIQTAKPAKARRIVAFAETRNPGNPGNLLLDARLQRKLGFYSAAGKAVGRLKRMSCGAMAKEALWEEAQLDFAMAKYRTCDRILDGLLQANHRPAEAHLLKAKLALFRGDKPLAQSHVTRARHADPFSLKMGTFAKEALNGIGEDGKLARLLRQEP